jgi:hypothetical protein
MKKHLVVFIFLVCSGWVYSQNTVNYSLPSWVKMGMSASDVQQHINEVSRASWEYFPDDDMYAYGDRIGSVVCVFELGIDGQKGLYLFGITWEGQSQTIDQILRELQAKYGDAISDGTSHVFLINSGDLFAIKIFYTGKYIKVQYFFNNLE